MDKTEFIQKKKELRKMISARKKECPIEERIRRSSSVIKNLCALPEFKAAKNVLFYWSMADEVFTQEIVPEIARSKNVFLPVVKGDDLLIKKFTAEKSLVDGESFAIPEPDDAAEEVSVDEIDFVVVPGVAFDLEGGRMGRGKGFYDRLLSKATGKGPYKAGICFDFQIVDEVPREPHDIIMDKVVSEKFG